MVKTNYNYVVDTKEKNERLVQHAKDNGWLLKSLHFSDYIHVPDGEDDLECGDMTNENRDGIVEFKQIGDLVGSTIGSTHLWEQVKKMMVTGLPFAVICYGNEYQFLKRSGVNPIMLVRAKQELFSLQMDFRFPAIILDTWQEAIQTATSYLGKCTRKPRGFPNFNHLSGKDEIPVAMGSGIPKIGPKTIRKFFEDERVTCMADLGYLARTNGLEDFIKIFKHIDGLSDITITRLHDGLHAGLTNKD